MENESASRADEQTEECSHRNVDRPLRREGSAGRKTEWRTAALHHLIEHTVAQVAADAETRVEQSRWLGLERLELVAAGVEVNGACDRRQQANAPARLCRLAACQRRSDRLEKRGEE